MSDDLCQQCQGSGISYTSLGDGCHFRDVKCPHCKGTGRGPCQIGCYLCSIAGNAKAHLEAVEVQVQEAKPSLEEAMENLILDLHRMHHLSSASELWTSIDSLADQIRERRRGES